jgi:hypothetical protein
MGRKTPAALDVGDVSHDRVGMVGRRPVEKLRWDPFH